MSALGTLKGQRTKARNQLFDLSGKIDQALASRHDLHLVLQPDLNKLDSDIGDLMLKLHDRLNRYDTSTDILNKHYVAAKDLTGQGDLLTETDAEDGNILKLRDSMISFRNYSGSIKKRIADLKIPDPVAKIEDDPAQLATLIATAVVTAMANLQVNAPQAPVHAPAPAPAQTNLVNLPKIDPPKFSGDILKWSGFWAQFRSSVHGRTDMSNIDKFHYLRSQLVGVALQTIEGLLFTPENYQTAIDLLTDRFGNNPMVVEAHYSSLRNMSSVPINCTAPQLRNFYDNLESTLRALTALEQDVDNLCHLSSIKSKLPSDVLSSMERLKPSDQLWSMPRLREFLLREVKIRETIVQSEEFSSFTTESRDPSTFMGSGARPKSSYQSPMAEKSKASHQRPSAGALTSFSGNGPQKKPSCVLCKKHAFTDQCPAFPTLEKRRQKFAELRLCFNCTRHGHAAQKCRSQYACYFCKQKGLHHRSLCPDCPSFKSSVPSKGKTFTATGQSHFSQSAPDYKGLIDDPDDQKLNPAKPAALNLSGVNGNALLASDESVIMQTAFTTLKNPNNLAIAAKTRLLFDCGADNTFVSSEFADRLQLPLGNAMSKSFATFGSKNAMDCTVRQSSLLVQLRDGSTMRLNVYVIPKICHTINRIPYGTVFPTHFMNDLEMADSFPTEFESSSLDMLIGNDYYFDFIEPEMIPVHGHGGLYLVGSKLGWILTGRITGCSPSTTSHNLFVHSMCAQTELESTFIENVDTKPVDPDMEIFWKLETLGIEPPTSKTDGEIAVQQFNETVKIDKNRIKVTWPWKLKNPDLPTNYVPTYYRFRSVAKRLWAHPELLKKYDDIIQNQLKLGIIEEVTPTTPEGPLKHYCPHHPVETPTKTTTKVRIVYDASAKTKKDNNSLNDCLYPGPVLIHDLCGLLLRFRQHRIAILADIEKAFLNIGLQEADRDVTRFFWLKDPTQHTLQNNLVIFRFCRIPFGVTSSPFLLASAVNYLLEAHGGSTAQQIKDDIYVDNVVTGASNVDSAMTIYNESQEIFNSVSLNLREWCSNSEAFIEQIPEVHRSEGTVFKVLGISWNTTTDCLTITGFDREKFKSVTTKREVLQAIASVYDPLGFFSPVTLVARIFLHKLWTENLGWDQKLAPDKLLRWQEIFDSLKDISDHPIPRLVGHSSDSGATFQLLCFCDASADSFASTVYLRSSLHGQHSVDLIFSKTRLSPSKKKLTIPRLELMAALIGVRSINFVEKQLHLPITAKMLWSDSKCVLHWIRSTKTLSVFVENRVKEIRQTKNITYRYVQTNDNPADMATRGLSVFDLNKSSWFHGPTWLTQTQDAWPHWDTDAFDQKLIDQITAETRKSKPMYEVSLLVGESPSEMVTPFDIQHKKYSSLNKLYRVTAFCLRFISVLKARVANKGTAHYSTALLKDVSHVLPLTTHELAYAKLLWELAVQKHWYNDVLVACRESKKHNLRDQLGIRVDSSGLLLCCGRFDNAVLTEAAKKPKLLPSKGHFTNLVINSIHKTLLHSGVSHTLAAVRQEYWIPQGRSRVRLALKQCRLCRKSMGGPYKLPAMAPWPKERMEQSCAFSTTGIDYFGPLYVKDGTLTSNKVWICLFTCVHTRAVHLELVTDMTTEQFLLCLRRFISKYGKPVQLISDNAAQFKLAKTIIDKAWSNVFTAPDTQSYIADQGIVWKFIVQFAPWTGGFYERMVGLVKTCLKKALGKLCLTTWQLITVLSEVQAVVNSRPLAYVSDDIHSDMALSPSHFLVLNPCTGTPGILPHLDEADPDYSAIPPSSAESLLLTWKKGQKHLDRFWKIWKDSYLLSLRERTQHHVAHGRIQSTDVPKPGDIVLIKDSDQLRGTWKMGKIQSLIPSQDGEIRAATILLPSKRTLNRPINLLFPIECPDSTLIPGSVTQISDDVDPPTIRPQRLAAIKARENIRNCVKQLVGLTFIIPKSNGVRFISLDKDSNKD